MTAHPRDLDTYAHRIVNAHRLALNAWDHIRNEQALVPTLRAATYDGERGGTDTPDPVANTVGEYDRLGRHWDDVLDAIATMGVCADMLDDRLRACLTVRARIDANDHDPPGERNYPRCIGDGTPEGATCEQIPTRRVNRHTAQDVNDQRCLDCGPRWDDAEQRRKEHAHRMRMNRIAAKQGAA